MKAIRIKDGIIHIAESKATCPHCERQITIEELDAKWIKCKRFYFKFKCKCKRWVGITQDIRGDFVAYEIWRKPGKK